MGRLLLPKQNNILGIPLIVQANVVALIDGKPIPLQNLHCTVTSNGLDYMFRHMFDSSYSGNCWSWINFTCSAGGGVNAATYSYSSPKGKATATRASTNPSTWSGCQLQNANDASSTYNMATATWTAVNMTGETMQCVWEFDLQVYGYSTYFTDYAYRRFLKNHSDCGVHTYIGLGTFTGYIHQFSGSYTRTDGTHHKVSGSLTPTADPQPSFYGFHLKDAASAGNIGFALYTSSLDGHSNVVEPAVMRCIKDVAGTWEIAFTVSQ